MQYQPTEKKYQKKSTAKNKLIEQLLAVFNFFSVKKRQNKHFQCGPLSRRDQNTSDVIC